MVLQSNPLPNTSEKFELDDQAATGGVGLGEATFDVVVPEEGVTYAEGCYRINDGNWHIYYLTNRHNGAAWIGDPTIRSDAIFQSGISGVSGVVPADCILNKKTIKKILAETVGVGAWIEVTGPNSLLLK